MYIRDEKLEAEEAAAIDKNDAKLKEELMAKRQSIHTRSIGNANIDTEITFEYGVRKLNDAAEKEKSLSKLPFQLQISYTAKDGSKALRVFTKEQGFTKDRVQAEKAMTSKDIYMVNAAQNCSVQVLSSNMHAAKYRAKAQRNFLTRNNIQDEGMNYRDLESDLMDMSYSAQASAMPDKKAQQFFSNAKISRSKAAKK